MIAQRMEGVAHRANDRRGRHIATLHEWADVQK
jgi:hypothetical protein